MHYFSKTSKRCPVRRVSFIVVYINLPRSLVHKFRPLYSSCTTTVDSGILELNLIPSTYIEALSFIFVQLSRHAGSRGVRASLGSRGCLQVLKAFILCHDNFLLLRLFLPLPPPFFSGGEKKGKRERRKRKFFDRYLCPRNFRPE